MLDLDPEQVQHAYSVCNGNLTEAARTLGITRTKMYRYVYRGYLDGLRAKTHSRIKSEGIKVEGEIEAPKNEVFPLPKKGVKRYIVTSAQNNTKLNEKVWSNLMILAHHYRAEILVGTYTYNLTVYGQSAVKYGTDQQTDDGLWFDERLVPYIAAGDNKNIQLAPDLIWCGRANILPTASRPLSGFETYTGRSSGIFPHAKIALESIPSGKFEKVKINYTTGTMTQRNYIQKKAGLKAEHHHTYGALIIEVLPDGTWFVRQINADSSGTIYDLDLKVDKRKLTKKNSVLAINWGDIHVAKRDEVAHMLAWGPGQTMDTLKPKYQFMNDLIDFHARNHHNRDHYSLFTRYVDKQDSVEKEMEEVADFLAWSYRKDCLTVVVDSNHDNAFSRWLQECDYRTDPPNALYFLQAQLAKYTALNTNLPLNMVEWAISRFPGTRGKNIRYLRTDESFVISDSIECGMHGHLGPNGSRGGSKALVKIGRKANIGHTHTANIHDGLYTAGVTGKLDQGYNVGPSSWSQSHIITYANGKRAIITNSNGKWRG